MKRNDVKARHAEGISFDTHVIANPTNTKEWIVFFKKNAGRSFFLVDDNEEVESCVHLGDLIHELRDLGIKSAEIHF
jgi:1,2-phenylacetyl-CoA epoxidase PaaB subunit